LEATEGGELWDRLTEMITTSKKKSDHTDYTKKGKETRKRRN